MTSEERVAAAAQAVKDLAAAREKVLAGTMKADAASAMAGLSSATASMLCIAKETNAKD